MRATKRRISELRTLASEGLPVEALTRWHWRLDTALDLWPAAGRWLNLQTGQRGKIGSIPIRELWRKLQPPV